MPIGAWGMSLLLDTVGGRSAEHAADLLVVTGVLAAVPTAASGLNDWSDTHRRQLCHLPWHGSIFRFLDGAIVRGPATSQQPRYDVRVAGDNIEVRALE